MLVDIYRSRSDSKILVMLPKGADLNAAFAKKKDCKFNAEHFEIRQYSVSITEEPRPKHEIEQIHHDINEDGFYVQIGHIVTQIHI